MEPSITRSLQLSFVGDWGQANFHRICSWLAQEFCDRSGPRSRVAIWNIRDGGIEALPEVHDGVAQLSIATPAVLMKAALDGSCIFNKPMPDLCALAVMPQNDRMVLAVDPKLNLTSFEDIRRQKPALRIATSTDDGTNFIGYVAQRFLEAHGMSKAEIESWGGEFITGHRPEYSLGLAADGKVDAVLQEAIMTPWWADVIEKRGFIPLAAEEKALDILQQELGLGTNPLPAGHWTSLKRTLPALDFSDFVVIVRRDLPEDVAYLLTWCLVETRHKIEQQYRHLPPHRSPLTYPLDPVAMAKPSLPLHPGARRYYEEKKYL